MTAIQLDTGDCEHCKRSFHNAIFHSGFDDSTYAYCDICGTTASLDGWNRRFPKEFAAKSLHHEICEEFEALLRPCSCGGRFRKGASPLCPHCKSAISAEYATDYIERNAPGSKKGWRWQRNWSGLYYIVIEEPANPGHMLAVKDPYSDARE